MEDIVLEPIYLGKIKGTNKKAFYSIDNNRKTCKRLTPISLEYVLDEVEGLNSELIDGNLKMLERLLKKKNMELEVDSELHTIKIGKNLLFSSSEEGIACIDRSNNVRTEFRSAGDIEEYVVNYKQLRQEIASAKRVKGKSQMGNQINYAEKKRVWEKFQHLIAKTIGR